MGQHSYKYGFFWPAILAAFTGCGPAKTTGDTGAEQVNLPTLACTDTVTVPGHIDWRGNTPSPCDGDQAIIVDGSIEVEPTATDLNGLYCVCGITGAFTMRGAYQIENLRGLLNLEFVDQRFTIARDSEYLNWDAILDNESLTDISDLSRLRSIGGSLFIGGSSTYNKAFNTYGYTPEGNPALTNLDGFSSLETIGGSLLYWGNVEVTQGPSFPALRSIGKSAQFRMARFEEGPHFASLETIGQELAIIDSQQHEIGHFPVLTEVGGLMIQGTPEPFTTLGDLSALEQIKGDLIVSWNPSIEAGHEDKNRGLSDLGDLSGLARIDGNVTITKNESLCEDQAHSLVEAVGEAQIGGTITIEDNRADCE